MPAALGRVVGTYLGAIGLAATYGIAVASGVSAPAALLRAGIAMAVLHVLGRALGSCAGHAFVTRRTRPAGAAGGAEAAS